MSPYVPDIHSVPEYCVPRTSVCVPNYITVAAPLPPKPSLDPAAPGRQRASTCILDCHAAITNVSFPGHKASDIDG